MTATRTDPAGARASDGVPALLRLQDSLPAYDRLMLARMRLIADTVVEECLDLEPEPAPELAAEPMSTSKWVLERMTGEHLTCLAAVLDSTITRAYSTARDALIACFSLHRTRTLVETGTMRFDRLQYAARRAHRLGDAALAELDAGIAELRLDLAWESYCRAVNDLIRLLTDDDDRDEDVDTRRRVEFWRSDPSEGKLLLTGPLEPLYALHRRLEATARAIARAQTGTFGEQLPPGAVIVDDRTVPQLMFDLMSTLAPGTEVEVLNPVDFARVDPATDPADAGDLADALIRTAGGAADACDAAPPADPDPASGPGSPPADPSRVVITCPTNQEWLRRQATVVVTVPFLSLTGHAELPGHWSDGGPVPVEMAQRFASRSSSFYLPDPHRPCLRRRLRRSRSLLRDPQGHPDDDEREMDLVHRARMRPAGRDLRRRPRDPVRSCGSGGRRPHRPGESPPSVQGAPPDEDRGHAHAPHRPGRTDAVVA